jgi:putative nucleotidyltransferase with HDIG domain
MPPHSVLPLRLRIYVLVVAIGGLGALAESTYQLYFNPVGYEWLILAALTLFTGSATVRLPSIPATISVSETFVFASVLLFGTAPGTLIVVLDAVVMSLWLWRRKPELHRLVFNVAAPAVSIWIGSQLFFATSGIQPLVVEPTHITELLLPLGLFAFVHFSLNSGLISWAIGLENRLSPYTVWRENFVWLSPSYFAAASVAALLVVYTRNLDFAYVGVIIPLLLVMYLTFKTAMGRMEDANRHLQEVNALHVSTIETLAMAIDAKDQITHGHVRRVQHYAVALARALGVKDESQIRAVEAAALLHDMGKLAVPEYILNKPGRLTPAEFDKMKRHASVGADILSAIDFPYPVIPIVRHHHENWDGSGYPAGLKGTDIPIGARILAVVDCFDALSSDRPYRPRLCDPEALHVLIERRGSMYDPLVVDTFLQVHHQLTTSIAEPGSSADFCARVIEPPTSVPSPLATSGLEDITASTEETSVLYELTRAVAGRRDMVETADLIASHLRRVLPTSLFVFYGYRGDTDELLAIHASGEGRELLIGLRIPVGQRLSGWVAANRQTILNSDPLLDLGEIARFLRHRPRSCLSTPVLAHGTLIGVMSFYSSSREAFTPNHRHLVENVARQAGNAIDGIVYSVPPSIAAATAPAAVPRLNEIGGQPLSNRHTADGTERLSVLLIATSELLEPAVRQQVLSNALDATLACHAKPHIMFPHDKNQALAIVFSNADAIDIGSLATRIQLAGTASLAQCGCHAEHCILIESAFSPQDGATLAALLGAAQRRLHLKSVRSDDLTDQTIPRIH